MFSTIYKGLFATEIAKDGILKDVGTKGTETKSEETFKVSPTEAEDPFQQSRELNTETNADTRKENNQIDDASNSDDEDKLLHGAEHKEENDAMDTDMKADTERVTLNDTNNKGTKLSDMYDGNSTQKQNVKKARDKGFLDLPSSQENILLMNI